MANAQDQKHTINVPVGPAILALDVALAAVTFGSGSYLKEIMTPVILGWGALIIIAFLVLVVSMVNGISTRRHSRLDESEHDKASAWWAFVSLLVALFIGFITLAVTTQ